MRLTPLDVQQRQFSQRFRGVDPHEVRQFLELCADEMEELVRETIALKEEVRLRDAVIADTRDRERALQEALIGAQRLAEEMKDHARKEAEIIVSEAELQGERIVQDAHNRRAELLGELADLRRQTVSVQSELRATLESHLRLLDAFSEPADDRVALLHKKGAG